MILALLPQEPSHGTSGQGPGSALPHANAIVELHVFKAAGGRPTQHFSTAGWDGRVVLWDASDAQDLIGALHTE